MQDNHNAQHYHDPTAAEAIKNCELRRYIVTIPGRMPDLNDMIRLAKQGRGSYQPYAVEKRRWTEEIAWICKAASIPLLRRISVKITWYEPDMRRDPDNVSAAQKYVLDGMVMAGIIKDDGQKYVIGISHAWRVDKLRPRVVVEIEEG